MSDKFAHKTCLYAELLATTNQLNIFSLDQFSKVFSSKSPSQYQHVRRAEPFLHQSPNCGFAIAVGDILILWNSCQVDRYSVRSKNPDTFHIVRHLTNRVTTFVDPSGSLRLAKRKLVRARR